MKKIIPFLLILCVAPTLFAAWSVGVTGGADYNIPDRNTAWAEDVVWSGKWGFNAGATVGYSFTDWFAIRSGLSVMTKNYAMTRTSLYMQEVYTDYNDVYLELPVMADFSFGGQSLRGHAYAGGYVGYWAASNRSGKSMDPLHEPMGQGAVPFNESHTFTEADNRFNAGLLCGLGMSYAFTYNWKVNLDGFFYYDLTSYVKQQSAIVKEFRYNSTVALQVGLTYTFGEAKK